jgi:hypothetical protein
MWQLVVRNVGHRMLRHGIFSDFDLVVTARREATHFERCVVGVRSSFSVRCNSSVRGLRLGQHTEGVMTELIASECVQTSSI